MTPPINPRFANSPSLSAKFTATPAQRSVPAPGLSPAAGAVAVPGNVPSTWLTTRSAGVLAHISSLPGDYGVGNLGPGARAFVDFLGKGGVRHWQICPLGPTGYGDSPYQSFSSFAGNPYFIDLGELIADGLLVPSDVSVLRQLPVAWVDYGGLYGHFWSILAQAHDRFLARGLTSVSGFGTFAAFRRNHGGWLEPFAAFMAIKAHFGGEAWTSWPQEFHRWHPALLATLPESVRHDADRHAFYQYLFFGQWAKLRQYAAARGVAIIGDVPIFVALDSADTWQNPSVFRLDTSGRPLATAGVPPDYFSATGQLWGNPLYDWAELARQDYRWWIDRLKSAFELFDIVRLDHFRGFDTFWEIPAQARDASGGQWRKGPGLPFFTALQAALPQARIIAEDLGYIGPDVVALRRAAGLPGMKILQFAYGHDAHNVNLPHFYPTDSVVYTGTHDNNTSRGWLEGLTPNEAAQVDAYFQLNGLRSAWPLIRAALATVSRLAVIPMQDLLDLPSAAALNRPGTAEGNWQWRFTAEQFARLEHDKLAILNQWIRLYDRTGDHVLCEYSEPPVH